MSQRPRHWRVRVMFEPNRFADAHPPVNELLLRHIADLPLDRQRIDGLPRDKVTPSEAVLARIREEGARVAAARAIDDPRTDFRDGHACRSRDPRDTRDPASWPPCHRLRRQRRRGFAPWGGSRGGR